MNMLTIISSKNPTQKLIDNVKNINNIKLNVNNKIIIIDSNSTDGSYYDKLILLYPNVEIHYLKNKNYELGAYKLGYEMYPGYDIYMCLQDTTIIKESFEVNFNSVYLWETKIGYKTKYNGTYEFINDAPEFIKYDEMKKTFDKIKNTKFSIATHCIFICNNKTIKKLLNNFNRLPRQKKDSENMERLIGLFFIHYKYNCVDIKKYFNKFHGKRL